MHVLKGRVVLGEPGGVGVEGAIAEVTATGVEGSDPQTTSATSGVDGTFFVVFAYGNVIGLTIEVSGPSGQLSESRALEPMGDVQETYQDLGLFILAASEGGVTLPRRPPTTPPRPRVSGRVVDRGGECSMHCLQVLIEAKVGDDAEFRPIAVTHAGKSGRFFVDYPKLSIKAAQAVISGIENPIPLPVAADGTLESEPLLVVDVPAAEEAHEAEGCDCDNADVPRLPGQLDLAEASSTYSSDLGAGCISFNTPNRAIEEFDFWTTVRTSQPSVRATDGTTASNQFSARLELGAESVAWDNNGNPTLFEAASVAHGHLLHFKQTWYADGYSLGDLIYSLPLAPGQKKLISVVEWGRTESVARREDTVFSESLSADLQHQRDVTEVINAALTEQSRGGSTSSTWGVGTGTGGAGNGSYQGFNFGALFGISGGYSQADSSAWQSSSRNLASTSMNSLRDRVMQAASAVRGIRSTVVTSVGETETVRAETDVVANHNHCHALTIQYFEVLRHFQMRHELVEVKECLFVPLPMVAFDRPKVLRWRDCIAPYLIKRDLAGAIEALRRVETNWADVPTPAARYADETVTEVFGDFDIEFQAYPPPLPDADKSDVAATALEQSAGAIIASIFFPPAAALLPAAIGTAASNAVSNLKALRTDDLRYRKFHRDYMPRFAARFVNELALVIEHNDGSTTKVGADFTLVSRYQSDRTLLISFSAEVNGITRADIKSVSVKSEKGIPDGVRCLVRGARCRYTTATFEHQLAYNGRLNDDMDGPRLVLDPATPSTMFPAIQFKLDDSTADPVRVRTPLDSWELRSPRDEDRRLAARLLDHLNANLEYYHHAIWWTMDPNRRYLLLDGFAAPNSGGRSIAQVVENRLIGVAGNSLVMPVAPGVSLDPIIKMAKRNVPRANKGQAAPEPPDVEAADPTGLLAYYAPPTPVPPARVSLPTKGVFAEAVMGACNACERIDDSRNWHWDQSPLDEPPAIQPSSTDSRQSTPVKTEPTPYPTPLVSIQQAPAAPEPSDLGKVFELLGREVFRDMAGLSGTQANAAATYKINSDAALAYGKEAAELAKQAAVLGAKDRAFAAIDNAEQAGQISKDEAHDLRLSALKTIVGGGGADAEVDAAKKRLDVVNQAGKDGVVDTAKSKELSGTILKNLATGDKPLDPEREAAAEKIGQLPAKDVSTVEVKRGDETTSVSVRPRPRTRGPRVGTIKLWINAFIPGVVEGSGRPWSTACRASATAS
ncbi:hypothetical protein M2158_004198 [Streptomyces sp. SAI-144]|uniref:hypothetical protein n=1 Tax=Streptomyces sp. SAI-144 TaxID=2940544 RepID=UPI002476B4DA|nr:hypothetical protein [Streptomyces sp. SAI-144]MDH6435721.1 hypothetical protein [Streptomyces sp. SAI-144]